MDDSIENAVPMKICRVCGDRAIGFNFDALTCGSCRSFFRRNGLLQNRQIVCKLKEKCTIEKSTRTNCPACRLSKCFVVGMKKDLILSHSCKNNTTNKTILPSIIIIYKNSTDFKEHELVRLIEVRNCVRAFCEENTFPVVGKSKNLLHVANLEGYSVERAVKFCKSFKAYRGLSLQDQLILLKNFYLKKGIVRGSFCTYLEKDGFVLVDDKTKNQAVFVNFSVLHEYNKGTKAYQVFRNFAQALQREMDNDSIIRDLILSLLLFQPGEYLSCPETIHYQHVLYHYLLRRHLEQKHSNVRMAKNKYYSLIRVLDQIESVDHFMKAIFEDLKQSQQREQIEKVLFEIYNFQTC